MVMDAARRLQKARRYREVAEVLLRHGLGFLAEDIGISRLVPWPLRWRGVLPPLRAHDRRVFGRRLRAALSELGPAFIKLGQVLSLRPDLVPLEIAEELRGLQDAATTATLDAVESIVEKEIGQPLEEVFSFFGHTPAAVASIAQVHVARLKDGAEVVLKVRRPDVTSALAGDLDILADLAEAGRDTWQSVGINMADVVAELRRLVRQETDFRLEARSMERLRTNFRGWDRVVVPRVYHEFSGGTVLTMERLRGASISEVNASLGVREARRAARILLRAFLKQILTDGFFHADPHPGNILWTAEGRIAFLDCGAVGHLEPETRRRLYGLIASLAAWDSARFVRVLGRLGVTPTAGHGRLFQDEVRAFLDTYRDLPLDEFALGPAIGDLMALVHRYGIRLPRELVLLSRALLTLDGVVRQLDPSLNLVRTVSPWLPRLGAGQLNPRMVLKRAGMLVAEYAEILEELPSQFERAVDVLERLADVPAAKKATENNPFRSPHKVFASVSPARQVALSVLLAAWILASATLILEGVRAARWTLTAVGVGGFALGGLLLGVAILVLLRPHR